MIEIHSLRPRHQARPHHHSRHELIYVLQGRYQFHNANGAHDLPAGSSILHHANSSHHLYKTEDVRVYAVQFDTDEQWFPATWLKQIAAISHDETGNLRTCLAWLLDWTQAGLPENDAQRLVTQAAMLRTALAWHAGGPKYKSDAIDRAQWHLQRNLEQDVTLPLLAKSVGLGRSTLARQFRQRFDISPMAYRRQCRLKHARHLIGIGELSLQEIATAVGFTSTAHLSNALVNAYGLRPSDITRDQRAEK